MKVLSTNEGRRLQSDCLLQIMVAMSTLCPPNVLSPKGLLRASDVAADGASLLYCDPSSHMRPDACLYARFQSRLHSIHVSPYLSILHNEHWHGVSYICSIEARLVSSSPSTPVVFCVRDHCCIHIMPSILQDTPVGQIARLLTKNRLFAYAEEDPNFQIPWEQAEKSEKAKEVDAGAPTADSTSSHSSHDASPAPIKEKEERLSSARTRSDAGLEAGLSTIATQKTNARDFGVVTTRTKTREQTQQYTQERFEVELEEEMDRKQSSVIAPQTTADGVTLIDWYTTDDPEVSKRHGPRNSS